MKIAIVGLGHVANHHQRALEEVDGVELVAVCDNNPEKLEEFDIPSFEDVGAMLQNTEAEAVLIATPNPQHVPVAEKVVESGRHALVEKPVAKSMSDLGNLLKKADNEGVIAYSLFHHAFTEELLWWLKNGEKVEKKYNLGNLTRVQAGFYDPYLQDGEATQSARTLEGSFIDSGINQFSYILRFLSNLQIQDTRFVTDHDYENVEEIKGTVWLRGKDQNGDQCEVILDTDWRRNLNRKTIRLTYDSGAEVVLDNSGQMVELKPFKTSTFTLKEFDKYERMDAHYVNVFEDFLEHYRKGEDNRSFSRECHRLYFKALSEK
ncbi:MAG: Gfo/Idh/MocA family protein [Candidatus Magasanikbacteria bacterium]